MTLKNNTKTILFASLIAAMILPFSGMMMAEAAPNENAQKDIEEVYQELAPYLISEDGESKSLSADEQKEFDKLQKELDRLIAADKKAIDKELRKELKEAKKLIKSNDIPFKVLAVGIDHLYIQLGEEDSEYESVIAEVLGDIPYKLEYGEGFKRGACTATTSDCDPEIGGLKILVNNPGTSNDVNCSLSIPMQKNNVDGFLTAGHCFNISGTGYVYQPLSTSSDYIGYSITSYRSFVDGGECDCAWIKDTSSTIQQNGVFAFSGAYWMITGTDNPEIGDQAMLRGFHNNNGNWYSSDRIDYDDIEVDEDGIATQNLMAFETYGQDGDSGGSVFYNGKYIGIAVAFGQINGKDYSVFVPWHHVTENLSGLSL